MTFECSLLERTLADNLSWNKARIKFLARFLIALLAAKTVNLQQLAVFFAGTAKTESNYKRIKRFLRFFEINEAELAQMMVRLMKLAPPFVITIDRTEWQLGKRWVNVLMLAIVHKGVAVPLLWMVFDKKGCSSDAERKMILEKYLNIFPASSIKFVTADREFASRGWLDYLAEKKIGFCLRIKANVRITDKSGKRLLRASRILQTAKLETPVNCRRKRKLWNHWVWLSGVRKANGEQILIVSAEEGGKALSNYCLRWQIETLFGVLKTRGFRLEDTHLTETDRVSRLLALLAIAFCWAIKSGEFVCRQKPLKRKKHGRLEKSIFRAGLDILRRLFCRPSNKGQKRDKKLFISFLSRT
jgi:hypothetical protein